MTLDDVAPHQVLFFFPVILNSSTMVISVAFFY